VSGIDAIATQRHVKGSACEVDWRQAPEHVTVVVRLALRRETETACAFEAAPDAGVLRLALAIGCGLEAVECQPFGAPEPDNFNRKSPVHALKGFNALFERTPSLGGRISENLKSWRNVSLYLNLTAIFRHPLSRDKRREFRRNQRQIKALHKFAATASSLSESALRTILMITHSWGGGTQRHVDDLINSVSGLVNVINLRIVESGFELTIPKYPNHPVLKISNNKQDTMIKCLRAFSSSRVHIHQILGHGPILRSMIEELSVPFDITIHDYHVVCPQQHLHAHYSAKYCGELGVEQCNKCIGEYNSFDAHDIVNWRNNHVWFVENADRVICPSVDVKNRIARYYPKANLVIAPHEASSAGSWVVNAPQVAIDQRLRVTIIGHLTAHKGREIVEACVREGANIPIEFSLIGAAQPPFEQEIAKAFLETGIYRESELVDLLKNLDPHVIWFPVQVPETYSFTLTAAIDSGLPIVASRIGALPERLAGRPLTWFMDDVAASAGEWLALFELIRERLLISPAARQVGKRAVSEPYYPKRYLEFVDFDKRRHRAV
jgi:glycosyltransferase involved in cell wall biosynthesis